MAKYKCQICGFVYDDVKEGVPFSALPEDWTCPLCHAPKALYEKVEEAGESAPAPAARDVNPLAWPEDLVKHDGGVIDEIHALAETGRSVTEPMETLMHVPGFDEILILGAQLARQPLDDGAPVNVRTVIGKRARKPMVLETPIYISHMSFGALSKETKVALSRGSALAKTAMCSGEGGILPEERAEAFRYIFEYVPNLYSVTDENLQNADAIEIKIGQGTKPGMGGHLPGGKVTAEIAAIRGKPQGQDVISPSHFSRLKTPADLKELVDELRERSGGRPIGVKLAAGHIEKDLEFLMRAAPDFVTFDGRGGATGSSPQIPQGRLQRAHGIRPCPGAPVPGRARHGLSAGHHRWAAHKPGLRQGPGHGGRRGGGGLRRPHRPCLPALPGLPQ